MNNFFRTIIAGYGAKKLGGGCFSTILIFILIYWALGNCNSNRRAAPVHSSNIHNKVTLSQNLGSVKNNSVYWNVAANK